MTPLERKELTEVRLLALKDNDDGDKKHTFSSSFLCFAIM